MVAAPESVLAAASLGEVAWLDESGSPRAAGVLPLVRAGAPVLALTFDRVDLAVSLAGATRVDLVVRDPRNTGAGWQPAGWRCTSRLLEDPDGEVFAEELLLQELRRYPPARRYADSPLLMREHWWYLPRLLVLLEPESELPVPAARTGATDLLLVTAGDRGPATGGVSRTGRGLRATWGAEPSPGPGTVFDQDATFPDLERWDTWSRAVRVGATGIEPGAPLPEPGPLAMPGLLTRWRAERRFAARCRRGLAGWCG